jgi:hypothetical protein
MMERTEASSNGFGVERAAPDASRSWNDRVTVTPFAVKGAQTKKAVLASYEHDDAEPPAGTDGATAPLMLVDAPEAALKLAIPLEDICASTASTLTTGSVGLDSQPPTMTAAIIDGRTLVRRMNKSTEGAISSI